MRAILVALLCASLAQAQTALLFRPTATDPLITRKDSLHVAYNPVGAPRNLLMVFLPGSYAEAFNYNYFERLAANLGYHALGLQYENELSVNGDLCLANLDSLCMANARRENFTGEDVHPVLNVPLHDAIWNRLNKALIWLDSAQAGQGWGQYLGATDSVLWDNVVLAGHSQGGGHAFYIATQVQVRRSIGLASVDWYNLGNEPANWMTAPSATPADRYYGFCHVDDDLYPKALLGWTALGMDAFGPNTNVDSTTTPYGNTHRLYTRVQPVAFLGDNLNAAHNCVATAAYAPKQPDGITPVYVPVWEYLLDATSATAIGETAQPEPALRVHPNPVTDVLTVHCTEPRAEVVLRDALGRIVLRATSANGQLHLGALPAGVYVLQAQCPNGVANCWVVRAED
jgi:hypothetical protein